MENLHTDVRVQSVRVPLIPLKILGHVNYTAYLNWCSRERNRVPQSYPKFIGNKWVFSKTNIIHRHENSPFQDYSKGHKKTRKSIAYYHYLVVISSINEELVPCVFINERTDQCPQNTKYPGCTYNQQSAHCLRVVTFNNLNHLQ